MARTASPMGIRAVFSASDACIDRGRTLNRIVRALAAAGPGEDLRAPAAQRSTPRGARVRVHWGGAQLATTVRPNRRPDDTE